MRYRFDDLQRRLLPNVPAVIPRPMRAFAVLVLALFVLSSAPSHAQTSADGLEPVSVSMSVESLLGEEVVRVTKDPAVTAFDEATYVRVPGTDSFQDGTIEVRVLSRLLNDAPDFARGFIGLAFRIAEDNSRFESIYLRPTNARADVQQRRNHSVQYFSYPDYKFDRLREEAPGAYESYADMGLNEWITMRVVVEGERAELYVNDAEHPALVVTDLKHGADASGAVGLWVDVGTEGYFTDLTVLED